MKRGIPGSYAGDCPALDGGPASVPHENRWNPAGQTIKSEFENSAPTASNAAMENKAEIGGANGR